MLQVLSGAVVFDGEALHEGLSVVVEDGIITALRPDDGQGTRLGGILAPGFVDLQVNGGGGRMVDGSTDVGALAAICAVHARLGSAGIMPTLITDTPEATARVIAAAIAATGSPGFLGLHLEGPHLDRPGAHDPGLIRPMETADLDAYLAAAARLPALMITLSPRAATLPQIAALARAGVLVMLGHTDCTAPEAQGAYSVGAVGATHLFNAMSQMASRAPGLVGTVLGGDAAAGLIADGVHVAPLAMRVALAAREKGLFLVSDAMAVAGTDAATFTLGTRTIHRNDGRLTLADGTLAGADLTLAEAVGVLVRQAGAPPARALAMASRIPADLIGWGDRLGRIAPGRAAQLVHLGDDFALRGVWHAGQRIV